MMNSHELEDALQHAIIVAKEAGDILLNFQEKVGDLTITHKEAQGVVSNADIEAENFIKSKLLEVYPEHEILGEEGAFADYNGDKDVMSTW